MRIERTSLSLYLDSRGRKYRKTLNHALGPVLQTCAVIDVYLVENVPEFSKDLAAAIFLDPIAQKLWIDKAGVRDILPDWNLLVEVAYKPGVTDPEALTAKEAIELSFGRPLNSSAVVQTARQYAFRFTEEGASRGESLGGEIASLLHNPLVEVAISVVHPRLKDAPRKGFKAESIITEGPVFPSVYPNLVQPSPVEVKRIPLDQYSDTELEELSKSRLLSLTLEEMKAIQAHYRDPRVLGLREQMDLGAQATDVELEMIAQTWSEHCKHKIFAASIHYRERDGYEERIDSLFRTYIKETTETLMKKRKDLRSVFHDNSGVVDFDEEYLLCMKVETHNSPSALDPYGGAITGIVG